MNEKIVSILKTFDKADIKNFKKFLISPYFSTGRDLTKYFDCIIKQHPEFEIGKEKLLKKYFGKLDDKDGKQSKILRAINSDFSKALDEYVTISSVRSKNFYSKYLQIQGYYSRGLHELGEKRVEEVFEEEESASVSYTKKLQLILLKSFSINFKHLTHKNNEIYGEIESQSEILLSFLFSFFLDMLNSLSVNAVNYNIQRKTEQLSLLLNNINLDVFLQNLRLDYPNYKKIKLDIVLISSILENKNFENMYLKLNELYYDVFDSLDLTTKMHYFTYILNHYSRNTGKEHILVKFEFVKFAIRERLFSSGSLKYIRPFPYKVFMLSGLYAGEIEWSEKFIEEYLEKLDPEIKENMRLYSYAFLYHYKADYLKSIDFISLFKFESEVFTYDMKLMLLKNYYELSKTSGAYFESLNYSLDAFSHYLKDNKKVSASYLADGKKFIAGMKLLIKANMLPVTKKEKKDLHYEIENFLKDSKNFWLVSRLEELL
ncbi:MAG: hypothetical protein JSS63_02100 [Bacteroidetes bacterium]|nr:hypothetical protein [Bacteroidota bacterium]